MFHLLYRHKHDEIWHKFGCKYETDIDITPFRKRYPKYRFRLLYEPV